MYFKKKIKSACSYRRHIAVDEPNDFLPIYLLMELLAGVTIAWFFVETIVHFQTKSTLLSCAALL